MKSDKLIPGVGREMPGSARYVGSGVRSGEPERSYQTSYSAAIAMVIGALAWGTGSALGGQCATEIAEVEAAVDALTSSPGALTAHQAIDAQLHRQPNANSVARAQESAAAHARYYRAALERARAADAIGDRAACLKALSGALRSIHRR